MLSLLGALLAGGIGMGSSAIGSAASAKQSYKYNRKLQQHAFDHQINMMQNAHQWQVQDLRNAGLNPILSAGGSPGSYSAVGGSASSPSIGGLDSGVVNTAKDILTTRFSKENALLDAQTYAAQAQAGSGMAQEAFYRASANKADAEAFHTDLNTAFEFSRDMLELRKRELYNRGSSNLFQAFGLFKDELDKFNGIRPWHIFDKGSSADDIKFGPYRDRRGDTFSGQAPQDARERYFIKRK